MRKHMQCNASQLFNKYSLLGLLPCLGHQQILSTNLGPETVAPVILVSASMSRCQVFSERPLLSLPGSRRELPFYVVLDTGLHLAFDWSISSSSLEGGSLLLQAVVLFASTVLHCWVCLANESEVSFWDKYWWKSGFSSLWLHWFATTRLYKAKQASRWCWRSWY